MRTPCNVGDILKGDTLKERSPVGGNLELWRCASGIYGVYLWIEKGKDRQDDILHSERLKYKDAKDLFDTVISQFPNV